MKKKLILILAAMMLCTLFVGCAGAQSTDQEADEMTPIYANQIKDGTYAIEVSSSSSMFKIVDAQLTVADGQMSAVLTLSGDGYLKLYMGTGDEALADTDDKCVYFVEDAEGMYTYEVPVAALDMEDDCAAWSIRKEKWYDRILVFQSALIPEDALIEQPADGEYQIDVTLTGGSGRASVESPAALTIKDGAMTAKIVWSSSHYTYMQIGESKYDPVNTQGNATFEIPVSMMDKEIAISAETTAMSTPHVIDYTLYFDSSTMSAGSGTLTIIIIAAAVVLAAIVLAVILVKRKRNKKAKDVQ